LDLTALSRKAASLTISSLSITMMLHRASPNDDQPLRQLDRLVDSERRAGRHQKSRKMDNTSCRDGKDG
jgi:hypothetical protein